MVQFLSINFFLGFLQFLLGFSKVLVFLCHPVYTISDLQCIHSWVTLQRALLLSPITSRLRNMTFLQS